MAKGMLWKFGPVVGAMVLVLPSLASRPAEKIGVRSLVQGKKVIPVVCKIGHWEITDIKLPDLVVTNNRKGPSTVERVEVVGTAAGAEAVRLLIPGAQLAGPIRETAARLNDEKRLLPTIQLSLGDVALPEDTVSEGCSMAAGQSLVLPLSKVSFLHCVGHTTLDGMEIRLVVKSGGKTETIPFPVQLSRFEQKGKYTFPLTGDVQMAFLPLSYIHHRSSASQEFAMDFVGANQKGAASFTEISAPSPKALTDYSIWGREVLAIGDGVVAEAEGSFPEDRMSDPAKFSDPHYVTALLKELVPKIGWTGAVAGNHVIIDHGNGEFSAYCHLQEGSIRVKAGDAVTRGSVIAKVGNTGNSGAPHLHFQLMDSRDFITANGLPVMFENVPPRVMIAEYPVSGNTLSFSDSIFTTVK
jgi:hypothetical protein